MQRRTLLFWLLGFVLLFFLISHFNEPTTQLLLSFDTEPVDSPEMVGFITSTLAQYGATATFFVTGEYVEAHPDLVRNLSTEYEIACHTMTHPRLPEINETQLEWELTACKELVENVTGKEVKGFRAPYNLLDSRTFAKLKALNYAYDASTFENLGWFYPEPSITEIPISSLGLLPLEDHPLIRTLHLGDLAFFLMRQDKDARVSIDFHPRNVIEHRGAFQYLVSSYADDGVDFLTHAQAAEQG